MLSIVLTILVFSLLVIVHELGHFVTAKLSGVQVNEFWLGMGPTILKKRYKETDYCIKAFPFGGAVVMEGEDDESSNPRSFKNAKKINQAIIMAAGSVMNFVLGFVIVAIILIPTDTLTTTTIDSFPEGFKYSSQNGLLEGDKILEIDGYNIYLASDISYALGRNSTQVYEIEILRNNEKVVLSNFEFKPDTFVENGQEIYRYGINFESKEASFLDKIQEAYYNCINYARLVWQGITDLFTGNVSINELSGPVGITVMIGEAASVSMSAMWSFVAFISINLGVMNLLPLPALDGGRLLILAFTSITKKPINPKVEGYIHGIGLLALLSLMVYVTFHDIFFKILK